MEQFALLVMVGAVAMLFGVVIGKRSKPSLPAWLEEHGCYRCQETYSYQQQDRKFPDGCAF